MNIEIRVLVFPVGEEPYDKLLTEDKTLDGLQELVGGYIECIRLKPGVDLWINDEGRINGMPPNRWVSGTAIHGVMVLARSTDEGSTVSVTDEDVDMYWDKFPLIPQPYVYQKE